MRGQRTRCNARTRKGKAITIAGKKLTPLKNNMTKDKTENKDQAKDSSPKSKKVHTQRRKK